MSERPQLTGGVWWKQTEDRGKGTSWEAVRRPQGLAMPARQG